MKGIYEFKQNVGNGPFELGHSSETHTSQECELEIHIIYQNCMRMVTRKSDIKKMYKQNKNFIRFIELTECYQLTWTFYVVTGEVTRSGRRGTDCVLKTTLLHQHGSTPYSMRAVCIHLNKQYTCAYIHKHYICVHLIHK